MKAEFPSNTLDELFDVGILLQSIHHINVLSRVSAGIQHFWQPAKG